METNIINESIKSVDPTIIKKPNQLKKEVVNLLNTRLGDEFTAYYFYRSAANWCHNIGYKKAAVFFDREAAYELEHGLKIQNYLTDWDCLPVIPKVETVHSFENLAQIIVEAYDMEYNLLNSYNETSRVIFGVDFNTFDFLKFYRDAQVDEVKEYSDLLNALQLINPENNFELLYFEQTYF